VVLTGCRPMTALMLAARSAPGPARVAWLVRFPIAPSVPRIAILGQRDVEDPAGEQVQSRACP